jgi:hypothetical protein
MVLAFAWLLLLEPESILAALVDLTVVLPTIWELTFPVDL